MANDYFPFRSARSNGKVISEKHTVFVNQNVFLGGASYEEFLWPLDGHSSRGERYTRERLRSFDRAGRIAAWKLGGSSGVSCQDYLYFT